MAIIKISIAIIIVGVISICLNKFFKWLFPILEKVVSSLLLYPIYFWILISLARLCKIYTPHNDTLGVVPFFIGIMLFIVFYAILCLYKQTGEIILKQNNILNFVGYIFLVLLSLSLNFAIQYDILYSYDNSYFSNVPETYKFVEFFIYSFSVMLSASISNIEPITLLTKGLVALEVLSSFTVLVLILGNYQEIGKLFQEDKKKIKAKK